ncbi:DUF3180 domain-containing protein [Nocardioides bruguierae]|uniref:DUF3180 domain-containing protein n=1 Tax=Nocardioides bruguierae TaxID=2945102 RepID=A0A9X2D8X4_9ACTN|nr:DUF3180 domain-containing protein [Nocardioides bruguierae]MCM0621523.1 DUF3180 domain-containing protein [Nocardioides bruguierae]
MTPPLDPPPDPDDGQDEPTQGTIQPASAGAMTALVVLGIVIGWTYHRVAVALFGTAPLVTWAPPAVLALVGVSLLVTARATHRQVHVRRQRLEAHRAVNRLALGRAATYVGALVGGGYLGYAISWLGVPSEAATQRLVLSGLAALAAVVVVAGGILLERACRVPEDDSDA